MLTPKKVGCILFGGHLRLKCSALLTKTAHRILGAVDRNGLMNRKFSGRSVT